MPEFHSLTIADVSRITADALAVSLAVPENLRAAFAFRPGQNVVLRVVVDGREERRNYSICSGVQDRLLRIGIKRLPGGLISNLAHDTFAAGQVLDVMPPSGRFVLPPSEGGPRHLVMLAAGVGITPIIAMVRHALEREPGDRVTLVFGNRRVDSTMFGDELDDLKDRFLQRFQLVHVLSHNDEIDVPMLQGRIDAAKVRALSAGLVDFASADHVFLCGPGSMIKDTRNELFALGVPRERVHHEFFAAGGGAFRKPVAAASAGDSAPAAAPAKAGDVEVTAVLDGVRTRFVLNAGDHVLDGALRAGLRVPYACRGGMCCTCRARIVEGAATMTANYSLEAWEIAKGFTLTCQAVPTTPRLVVDFDAM